MGVRLPQKKTMQKRKCTGSQPTFVIFFGAQKPTQKYTKHTHTHTHTYMQMKNEGGGVAGPGEHLHTIDNL